LKSITDKKSRCISNGFFIQFFNSNVQKEFCRRLKLKYADKNLDLITEFFRQELTKNNA